MNEILMCGTDPVGQLYKDTKAEATSIAPIEVSPTESSHNVGTHIMYGGIRYKVTSSISVGDTLTIGENIVAENIESNIVYSNGVSVKDKIDELGYKIGNSKIYNYFNAPLTFEVDLPFTPSSSIGGSALIFNGNQGYCGLIKVDTTPNIARIIGNAELSVSISGSKLTITSNNRLWGSTSIILNWN